MTDEEIGLPSSQKLGHPEGIYGVPSTNVGGGLQRPMREEDDTLRLIQGVPAPLKSGAERDRPRLVTMSGATLGVMHAVTDGAVIGRAADAPISIPSDEVSRKHARFLATPAGFAIEDLGSMNGTRVNGVPIASLTVLADGDKIQLGAGVVLRYSLFDQVDEAFQERIVEHTLRDGLTGAFNRRYLAERLDAEFAYAVRHDTPLCLLLVDVDHFKRINDTYGHVFGDQVLVGLSQHMLRVIRAEDVFARFGGEEFAVLSRGLTGEGARLFAERLRSAVSRFPFRLGEERVQVTVSVGIATMPDSTIGQPRQLVEAADGALYRAKADGRDRVRIYGVLS